MPSHAPSFSSVYPPAPSFPCIILRSLLSLPPRERRSLRFALSLFLVSEMLLLCSLVATPSLELIFIVLVSPFHLIMQVTEILHCQVPSQLSLSPGIFPDFSSCLHPLLRPFCLCLYWEACFLLWFIVFIVIPVLLRSLPWIPKTGFLKTGNRLR